jgi:predicted NUDIX family NTP pyrophosphohydrolase
VRRPPSAGLLLHRRGPGGGREVLLGHLGGPFWRRRDAGAWTVPKGELEPGEDPLAAARREFTEELGLPVPPGTPHPLGEVRQSGGKVVTVWALEADLDPAGVTPGTFPLEWPPGSGVVAHFPELDRVAWLALDDARTRIVRAQAAFLDRLGALHLPRL